MPVLVRSLVLLCFLLGQASQPVFALSPQSTQQLEQLERRYFGHTFASDSEDARTQRLEKLIFGDAVAGDPAERIKNLAATIPAEPAPESDSSSGSASDNASDRSAGSGKRGAKDTKSGKATVNAKSSTPTADDAYIADDESGADSDEQYPHITALEKAILGKSYAGEMLTARIARMETKAFGAPSDSPDLSQRSDALDKYAGKTLHKNMEKIEEKASAGGPGSAVGAGPESRTGSGLGSKGSPQHPSNAANVSKQIATLAASALLGMTPLGLGRLGLMAPQMMPGYDPQERRAAQQQQQQKAADAHVDDGLIYAATPPAQTSRMLTRIGWCEVQVFGHPCPELHLAERLTQLSRELNYRPGASSIELMDNIGALIKSAQAHHLANQGVTDQMQAAQQRLEAAQDTQSLAH